MFQPIKAFFSRFLKKKPKKEPVFARQPKQGNIVFAFESGGEPFFAFADDKDMPAARKHAHEDIMLELSYRTDREYLETLYKAVAECILKDKKQEGLAMLHEAAARLNWIFSFDLMYKLAAVYYLDANENPHSFSWEYALRKIAKWKQESDVPAFFLKSRLLHFLPSAELLANDIPGFLAQERKLTGRQLQTHFAMLSQNSKHDEATSKLKSQIESLKSYATSGSAA